MATLRSPRPDAEMATLRSPRPDAEMATLRSPRPDAKMVTLGSPRSVFSQTVDRLGASLVADAFPDGMLPIEADLAASLGVGRNLLRESVKVLASKGLVDVKPKRGTRLRPRAEWNLLDPDVLDWIGRSAHSTRHSFDVVEFRLIVEPLAGRLAALRATDAERDAIEAACLALEACAGEPALIAERDLAFHGAIHLASHNALLGSIGALLGIAMQTQVRTTTDHPGAFERGLALHREVTQAIRQRDAAWAEDAARRLVLMPYGDLADRLAVPELQRLTPSGVRPVTGPGPAAQC